MEYVQAVVSVLLLQYRTHDSEGFWQYRVFIYSQGHGSVGQEAGLQGVHQLHIVTHHPDPDLLPAQLLRPLRGAVAAFHYQVRTVPVAQAGAQQPGYYAQQNQRTHGGL